MLMCLNFVLYEKGPDKKKQKCLAYFMFIFNVLKNACRAADRRHICRKYLPSLNFLLLVPMCLMLFYWNFFKQSQKKIKLQNKCIIKNFLVKCYSTTETHAKFRLLYRAVGNTTVDFA